MVLRASHAHGRTLDRGAGSKPLRGGDNVSPAGELPQCSPRISITIHTAFSTGNPTTDDPLGPRVPAHHAR